MTRFTWKSELVFSLRLRDNTFALGQLLKSPYMVFFDNFQDKDRWKPDVAQSTEPLFFCAVTKAFVKLSPLNRQSQVLPAAFSSLPRYWIKRFPGSRRVTVWEGTPHERSFFLLSSRPGGQLVEIDINSSGPGNPRIVKASIPLDDDVTIDKHDLDVVWPYPNLNERLLLCKQLGQCVDPEKDLTFDRPLRREYSNYIDILANHGTLEDWGYDRSPSS